MRSKRPPSVSDKEAHLDSDNKIFHQFCNYVLSQDQKHILIFVSSTETDNDELLGLGKAVVRVLSKRVKSLQNVKLAQSSTSEKLKTVYVNE